jgi:type VI secretion system protein ImpG
VSDSLLEYYQRELVYLRQLGGQFSETHPKIAGRLRMTRETIEDPHVSRLIESVAFLNARIRRKLDDEFPEIAQAVLSILNPHFLAPTPSMAIAQFEGLADASAVQRLAAGTQLETDRAHGEPCTFRTVYPVELWPFKLELARLLHTPFVAPPTPRSSRCPAVIQLRVRMPAGGAPMSALKPESLRFYLHGQPQHVHPLYELLRTRLLDVAVATSERDKKPAVLPASALVSVGFEPDEAMLPLASRASHGQRLLAEVLAFPLKFLFFDLLGLPAVKLAECGQQLDLYLYLDQAAPHLEHAIGPDLFALGCTPIVNLFEARAAPIDLLPVQHEYRVVPDPRRPQALEVHSVEEVRIADPGGESRECFPFYSISHAQSGQETRPWWHVVRKRAAELPGHSDAGSETFLRFVDLNATSLQPRGSIATVRCLLTNRDVPATLHQPSMVLVEGGALKSLRCLTPLTAPIRPQLDGALLWRSIAQLSLNHLSLVDGDRATAALREMLRLLDFKDSPETRNLVEGIHRVESEPAVMRVVSGGLPGMVRGLRVTFSLEERRYVGTSALLFASVLERFVGTYCGVNSFVQSALKMTERQGEVYRWPARAGDREIL